MPVGNRFNFWVEVAPPGDKSKAQKTQVLDAVADRLYALGRLEVAVSPDAEQPGTETWTGRIVDVDWASSPHPDAAVRDALELINKYGGIEGDHHRAWVLDQVVRLLTGTDEGYARWVAEHKAGEDGPETYDWYEGIAP